MVSTYSTEVRLLEQLALHEQLSISQLARKSGLSYPTVLQSVSSIPILSFHKVGKEKRSRIRDDKADVVYPFLISMRKNKEKKAQLAFAYLTRKGFDNMLIGGELALQMQLNVRDVEPDPQIEIRTKYPPKLRDSFRKTLQDSIYDELASSIKIVPDDDLSASRKMGLLAVSTPEKLLVDAIVEKRSEVFIENIAEAMVNSHHGADMKLLAPYAKNHGVFDQVLNEIKKAKESGFP